jgi:hypothetical protein
MRVHNGDRVQSPFWIENDKIDLSDVALADQTAMPRERACKELGPMPNEAPPQTAEAYREPLAEDIRG